MIKISEENKRYLLSQNIDISEELEKEDLEKILEIIDDAVVDNILDNDNEPDQIGIYLQRIYDTIRADNIDYFN